MISLSKRNQSFYCRHRDTTLIDFFLRKTFRVYSGKSFKTFVVTKQKLGHKIGEFSFSKIRGVAVTQSLILRNKRKKKEKAKAKGKGKGKSRK